MSEMPERLWIDHNGMRYRASESKVWDADVEYIRADLHDKEVEKLKAEVEELEAKSLSLRSLTLDKNGLDVMMDGELARAFTQMVASAFHELGGKNYVECRLRDKDGVEYILHYQRADKPTPHELRQKAEAELSRVKRESVPIETLLRYVTRIEHRYARPLGWWYDMLTARLSRLSGREG